MELKQPNAPTATDPVCGMVVNPDSAAGSFEYDGKTYYFCGKHCLDKFRQDPQSFLQLSSRPVAIQPVSITRSRSSATFTCPMHPEVRQVGHGSCPKCGMALEPEVI